MMWRGASTGRKIWFRGAEASYQQGGAHTKAVRQRLKPVRRAGAGVSNGAEYEPQIRAAMADLASNFPLQADDVEGTLASVTSAAVELIRGVDHADVLLIDQGRFDSMAATAPIVEELDAIRQRFQEGPCLQAAMNDPVIRCIDLRDEPRFPQFAAAATKLGVYSMLSFQLYIYRGGAGALNLLGGAPRAFAQEAAYRRTAGPSARQRWS
jgi:hypothetical protein